MGHRAVRMELARHGVGGLGRECWALTGGVGDSGCSPMASGPDCQLQACPQSGL